MLHVKDGIGIATRGTPPETNSRGGSPRATGTGELDFRPILAAANNRVHYYHQEHDGGTLADANTSFTNLKGSGPASVATMLALPATFPTVAAGTPAAANVGAGHGREHRRAAADDHERDASGPTRSTPAPRATSRS